MKMNYFSLFVKKTLRYLLKPLSFLPAILVAAMIFGFSAQDADHSSMESVAVTARIVHSINYRLDMQWTPGQQAHYVEVLEVFVRKIAHFTEYAVFAVTLAIPLYVYEIRGWKMFFWIVFLAACYAGLDEFHQMFSDGRTASLRDVGIDTCGAILGAAVSYPFLYLARVLIFWPLSLEKERLMKKRYEERERQRR